MSLAPHAAPPISPAESPPAAIMLAPNILAPALLALIATFAPAAHATDEAAVTANPADSVEADTADAIDSALRLPARRFDTALTTGYPETLGICLQWHAVGPLVFEACGGATRDIGTLSQAAKVRFDLRHTRGSDGIGTQSSLAPMLGARQLWTCPQEQGCALALGAELGLSYEHVWWTAPRFGWALEVDFAIGALGTRALPVLHEPTLSPLLRLQFGAAF